MGTRLAIRLKRKAVDDWISIKASVSPAFGEDADALRSTYLLKVMGDCLLVALPVDGRIAAKLSAHPELQAAVRSAGYGGAKFTVYPDNYTLQQLGERFPDIYAALTPALKKRAGSGSS